MRALNYLELESHIRGGMTTAAAQQRKALATTEVEVVTSPWRAGNPVQSLGTAFAGEGYFADYDVAHCNLVGPGSIAVARHAKRHDIPLVLHAHFTAEDFAESYRGSSTVAPALRPYLRWFYSQADLLLCPSEYTKGVLESYPVSATIEPITNGVDVESLQGFEALREETRERFDLDGMVVFAVGEVIERKGLTTFCETAQATDYDFAWFGPYETGPQASAVTKHWTEHPPANVQFTGFVDDKRSAFGAGDVYLFPAKVENQGIAVLEAMATGRAIVVRDIPVFEEFLTDGHDCLKCETTDEFVAALDRLNDDPDLRERLGANARESVQAHTLDRVGERLADCYARLLAEGEAL